MNRSYTHTGRKPNVAYVHSGSNFGHTTPRPGRVHALNLDDRGNYLALCGEKIHDRYSDPWTGDPITGHVGPAGPESDKAITCARCRRAAKGGAR